MKIGKLRRQNDVNLAKIRHVFDYNLLTDVVLEHNLQIYSKAQWLELKIFIHALRIDLGILGLIREFKHANSNMRH